MENLHGELLGGAHGDPHGDQRRGQVEEDLTSEIIPAPPKRLWPGRRSSLVSN